MEEYMKHLLKIEELKAEATELLIKLRVSY